MPNPDSSRFKGTIEERPTEFLFPRNVSSKTSDAFHDDVTRIKYAPQLTYLLNLARVSKTKNVVMHVRNERTRV